MVLFWRDAHLKRNVRLITTVRAQGITFLSAVAVVACVLFFSPSRDVFMNKQILKKLIKV